MENMSNPPSPNLLVEDYCMDDWVEGLKHRRNALQLEKEERGIQEPVIYRVKFSLREGKDSFFNGTIVSLGLFQKQRERHSQFPSGNTEHLKSDAVFEFLAESGRILRPEDWRDISLKVVPEPEAMKRLYDGLWHLHLPPENIQSILATDAIFLTGLLLSVYYRKFPSKFCKFSENTSHNLTWDISSINSSDLLCDVLKLENQIPLKLMGNVIAMVLRKVTPHWTEVECRTEANKLLGDMCHKFVQDVWRSRLPLVTTRTEDGPAVPIELRDCHHLLDYVAQAFWNGTKAPTSPTQAPRETSFTARELQRHGIEFQGREGFPPTFKKHPLWPWKATLFLPTIKGLYDQTETYWRNLVAYEDRHQGSDKPFISYLHFMDSLINTEKDVAPLCTGRNPVIVHIGIGDHKAVADLFNSMTKGIACPPYHDVWSSIKEQADDYLNARFRTLWTALWETSSQRPWLPISVVAALFLLTLAFLQTVYTLKSFYQR